MVLCHSPSGEWDVRAWRLEAIQRWRLSQISHGWTEILLRLAVCWPPPHQKAMHWCRLPWEVVEALPLELFEKWDLWHWGMWFSAVTGVG